MRRMSLPPGRVIRRWWHRLRLAVDEIVHRDEVVGAARADIGNGRAQGCLTAGDQHPGDDRGFEYRANEGEPLSAEVSRRCDAGDLDAVRVEILDPRSGCLVDIGEDHPEAFDETGVRGAYHLEIDRELVRADGHEQLLGRERLELVCQPGVDRREGAAVYPESCPG